MFARGPDFVCIANISSVPVALPAHDAVVLASAPLEGGRLPVDAAAWLRVGPPV
jgi:alpha-glucosidase